MKLSTSQLVSLIACVMLGLIVLQGGEPPARVAAVTPEPPPKEPTQFPEGFDLGKSRWKTELAQAPSAEPLSIKISGPRHPVIGDRPVWFAEITGDAGTPSWRISPPTTGLVVKLNGQLIEWEPQDAGLYTIHVSVGGANKSVADDAFNIEVLAKSAPPPPAPMPPPQQQETINPSRLATLPPRDKHYWNTRVADLISNMDAPSKFADARSVSGFFTTLILRVERDNFDGNSYTNDLERQAVLLFGPQRSAPWVTFMRALGNDLTLQDLRWIETALAHVVPAAHRSGPRGGKETAKET